MVLLAKTGFQGAGVCGVESGEHSYSDQEVPGRGLKGLVFRVQAGGACLCVKKTPPHPCPPPPGENMYLLYFWSLRLSRPEGLLGWEGPFRPNSPEVVGPPHLHGGPQMCRHENKTPVQWLGSLCQATPQCSGALNPSWHDGSVHPGTRSPHLLWAMNLEAARGVYFMCEGLGQSLVTPRSQHQARL